MPLRMGWIAAAAWALTAGEARASLVWSPDGQWLAYTVAARAEDDLPAPGWIFGPASELGKGPGWVAATGRSAASYRLWATRVETGASVLLEESAGPLTAPGWGPDGKAMAFGRMVPEGGDRARFEVVVQEALDRKRVVLSRPVVGPEAAATDLSGLVVSWSPGGRYLAVPLPPPSPGLAILRADNGRVLKVLEGASRPSWSPDGTKLAFVQAGDQDWLHYIDTNFGPPRPLVGLGRTSQPPCWSRDGRWVMALAHLERVAAVRGAEGPSSQTDLIRFQLDAGKLETVANLSSDPVGSGRWGGAWFSLDRAGEELFFTSDIEGQPSVITWFRPRDRVTLKKDNPIDFAVRVVGLAVAPAGKVLAVRAGASPPFAAPGLWNLAATTASDRFRAIVPDDATRVEWLTNLIAAARIPLGRLPAAVVGDGRTAERPTLLPVPGEVPGNDEIVTILRRLARTGRPLCDRPADAPPASPELLAFLDEARLFFDFAREDYAAALASLEAIEARTTSPDHRLRLLSVRAQALLGQGQADRAEQTIAFLQAIRRGAPKRIEVTPAGVTLTDDPDPRRAWPDYLAMRAKKAAFPADEAADPADRRNPDNFNIPAFRNLQRELMDFDRRFPMVPFEDNAPAALPPRPAPRHPVMPRFPRPNAPQGAAQR